MSKKDTLNKMKKKPKNMEEIVTSTIEQLQVLDVLEPRAQASQKTFMVTTTTTSEGIKKAVFTTDSTTKTEVNVVYKVVYPDDLNLKAAPVCQKAKSRAGRPKKSKVSPPIPVDLLSQKCIIKVPKTRSGREVKFPKHIQNNFKNFGIEDDNSPADPNEIKTTDFDRYTGKEKKEVPNTEEIKPFELDSIQKKRRIAAQYRCPKCKKAYLGRSKILEHLRKNPSHGPMHQNEENHFEVWNYLVSITQKCTSSERGPKFCQELSNLLHNLSLLTNALFKKLGSAANEVKIDKVLGNAIGLSPGTYYFDDNNLYKDVTVLQLMGNTDFLNSIRSKTEDTQLNSLDKNCNCGKLSTIDELVLKSMLISSEANEAIAKKIDDIKIDQSKPSLVQHKCETVKNVANLDGTKQFTGDEFFVTPDVNLSNFDYEMKPDLGSRLSSNNLTNGNAHFKEQNILDSSENVENIHDSNEKIQSENLNFKANVDIKDNINVKHFPANDYFASNLNYDSNNFSVNYDDNNQPTVLNHINIEPIHKPSPKSPKIKIQSNILICPPNPNFLQNVSSCSNKPYNKTQILQNKSSINPELLTDNSVLMPITNLHHSVDELMLPVSSEPGNILDNSSSSDELMNVDQFVNERFRRITESDLEVINGNSLNIDLPALDLFQFHNS